MPNFWQVSELKISILLVLPAEDIHQKYTY
jgi:hypothetical protein